MAKQTKKVDPFVASLAPETDDRIRNMSTVAIIAAIVLCFIFKDLVFEIPDLMKVAQSEDIDATMEIIKKKKEKKKKQEKPKVRKKTGGGGKPKGKGKPKAVNSVGVLKIIEAKTSKKGFNAYSLMDNKNFAKDINKVINNVSGLKKQGKTKIGGRRGKANAKFNSGYAAGGSGGIGDALSGLLGGGGGPIGTKARGKVGVPKSKDIDWGSDGYRSKNSIMRVIKARQPGLRYIYNKYLKKHPGFSGKVTLRFTIAPSGSIIKIAIANSTTGIPAFDKEVKNKVRRWKFEKIKSGNTTITVPFSFAE